eukprot:5650820-Pyramimonas_sp.AAC.1
MSKISVVVDPPPMRAVIAKARLDKGSITLVPVTPQVVWLRRKDKQPKNSVDLCAVADDVAIDLKFVANPIFKKGTSAENLASQFIAPFWYVESTTDPSAANCELEVRTVNIPGDHWHSGQYDILVLKTSR